MSYLLHLAVMLAIYCVLAGSLNLALGFGGLVSLCHAAFFGTGAYAFTLLMIDRGWAFVPAALAAAAFSGLLAFAVAWPSLRLRGDFFILATLGFQKIVSTTLFGWESVTRGPFGIPGIPRPAFLGSSSSSAAAYAAFALAIAGGTTYALARLLHGAYGRNLQATRDDHVAAASLGRNVAAYRMTAFAASAALAGVAGALYASYSSFIDPTSFTLDESVFILCAVIVGGSGNVRGPVVGAAVLVLLPELLRFVNVPDSVAANTRQVLFGALLVVLMLRRPQGLAGRYAFD